MTDKELRPSTSDNKMPHWRSAKSDDLEMINRIADMIHVDLPERPEVLSEKLQLFPQGCFALLQNGAVVGYGVSHPCQLNNIPPLNTFLGALPASPKCLFIHDVVVLPQARKFGASGELIKLLAGVARQQGVSFLALVSVYDTDPLWARRGFQIASNSEVSEKLKSYGATAKYMTRRLN